MKIKVVTGKRSYHIYNFERLMEESITYCTDGTLIIKDDYGSIIAVYPHGAWIHARPLDVRGK